MNEQRRDDAPPRAQSSRDTTAHASGPDRPTRGPRGDVRWWERRSPSDDELLWEAVKAVQRRRQALGLSVQALRRRVEANGLRIRRETLSRVLNGTQPTTWATAEALAAAVGLDLATVLPHPDALDLAAAGRSEPDDD